MSAGSGIPIISCLIRPTNQTGNTWTDNTVPVTYLDKGSYSILYNYGFVATAGSITSVLSVITIDGPLGTPSAQEIASNSPTGPMGGGVFIQSIQNNIYIENDNTPIYLGIIVSFTSGTIWGWQQANTKYAKYYNRINILAL